MKWNAAMGTVLTCTVQGLVTKVEHRTNNDDQPFVIIRLQGGYSFIIGNKSPYWRLASKKIGIGYMLVVSFEYGSMDTNKEKYKGKQYTYYNIKGMVEILDVKIAEKRTVGKFDDLPDVGSGHTETGTSTRGSIKDMMEQAMAGDI